MLKSLVTVAILTLPMLPSAQSREKENVYDLPIPKNLEQCYTGLNRTLPDIELQLIKNLPEHSIYANREFRDGTDFFHAWKLYDGSRLTKYFNKLGLAGSHEIYEAILVSYHRHLNHLTIDLDGQIKKYQAKQKADYDLSLKRVNSDSLNGLYIPKDINECLTEFDKVYDQKSKEQFKNWDEEKAVNLGHLGGPGKWLRNNWGLWGGSRLQKYFMDLG